MVHSKMRMKPAPKRPRMWNACGALVCILFLFAASPMAQSKNRKTPPPTAPSPATPEDSLADARSRITQDQAKELFRSVKTILQFDSHDTGYTIARPVEPQLVTRDQVVAYLNQQIKKSENTQRLQRSELVLKKFGLLDRDFQLGPFLLQLLREQIAGYYDEKSKTVNLLDWIAPEEQKPVLAHELTHALQDQHVALQTWEQQGKLGIAKNVTEDNLFLANDETDTARDAVLEGQAMAVFIDYALQQTGKTLLTAPDVVEKMKLAMADNSDSPVMARAPLLLQQSLVFPYREGLDFITTVLRNKGPEGAFLGTLDHPPSSTYQILQPQAYLSGAKFPLLTMPDIHGLIDSEYKPYDIGVMGALDVRILAALFSGQRAADALTPAWRGGIYYAAQRRDAKTLAERSSPASLSLLYLSNWTTPKAARRFATIYAAEIGRKYDHAVQRPPSSDDSMHRDFHGNVKDRIWDTPEGPVLLTVSGRTIFVSEGFSLPLARKLQLVMVGSVASDSQNVAANPSQPQQELTFPLRQFLGSSGIPRAALQIPQQIY